MGNRGANPSGHILENKPAKQDNQKKTSSLSTFFVCVCVFNFEKMKISMYFRLMETLQWKSF